MKRLLPYLLAFPFIVTWETTYWIPAQCEKDQQPNIYAGNCINQVKGKNQVKFTDKPSFDKWMEGMKKGDPRFVVENIEVYEFDDKASETKKNLAKQPDAKLPK